MLDEQFTEGGEVKNALLLQHTQLLEQLDQEASMKGQLQLELHKAEGENRKWRCRNRSSPHSYKL